MANISIAEAHKLSKTVLLKAGVDNNAAKIITDILLEADMLGRPTHGLIRLPGIVSDAKKQINAKLHVVRDDSHYTLLDGGGKSGYLAAYKAMELALKKAGKHGLALGGVKNSGHCGMLGYYTRMALKKDFIGIGMCNTRPMVAAWGGVEAVFGTNPIAIAIPSAGLPLVLDMSTSSATFGDLLVAMKDGKKLRKGVALDSTGRPTVDPAQAKKGVFLPFGGYKGFGLGLAVQILAGALVDAEMLKTGGILFLVINPGIFLPVKEFKKRVAAYINFVKNSRKAEGVKAILIPGERSERSRQKSLKHGIGLDDDLLRRITKQA